MAVVASIILGVIIIFSIVFTYAYAMNNIDYDTINTPLTIN